MIAFGTPTDFAAVLAALCDRLSRAADIPRSRVFVYTGRPQDVLKGTSPPDERFVAVQPQGLPVEGVGGGGAAFTRYAAEVHLNCWGRNGTDKEKVDFARLADAANGLIRLVDRVIGAAHVWPADADGESILVEPSRLLPGGPRYDPETPPAGWGWCRVPLQLKFRLKPPG